jgi:hypothetical protein
MKSTSYGAVVISLATAALLLLPAFASALGA